MPPDATANQESSFTIRRMRDDEAAAVAKYHKEGIPAGVLAELGVPFMTPLYQSINHSDVGFVFVAVDQTERVVGFVCGTTNLDAIFRRVLIRNGLPMWWRMFRIMFSSRTVKRVIDAVRYPSKMQADFPKAELLSIVVDPEVRGGGASTRLMQALLDEFQERAVSRVKVMVGADLERANAYYRKHGFELAGSISSHGQPSNIYVITLSAADESTGGVNSSGGGST